MELAAEDARVPIRERIVFAVKAAVTIALCALIVSYVDWRQFADAILQCNPWLVASAFACTVLALPLSTFKWQQLLAVHGLRYNFWRLQRWYLTGMFLCHCLPTTIGGDAYRIMKTLHNPQGKSCAVIAVFVERVSGFAALMVLGVVSGIMVGVRRGDALAWTFALLVGTAMVVAAIVFGIIAWWGLLDKFSATRLCPKRVASLIQFGNDFREHPARVGLTVLISFAHQGMSIFVAWLLLWAVGARPGISEIAVAVAIVETVGLIPVSLGGLGLVDGSFVYLVAHFGVDPAVALSAFLLRRGFVVPMLVAGAVLMKDRTPADSTPGEQLEAGTCVQGIVK